MEKLLTQRAVIVVLGLLTLWRLYLASTLQLHPDEAYYWLWSTRLDFGYFDHAPMVAWFIWLSTRLSNAEVWVRLSGVAVPLLMSGLLWRLARQIHGSVPVAAGSVLLFNAFPLSLLGLLVMTPDVPVLLFWALAVWLLWELSRSQRTWLWYALGAVCGLALLSKYTAILLAPCVLLYLLLTEQRRWLRTPHPYLALLLAVLLFLPVVYWNSLHDWVSFRFQFQNRLSESAASFAQTGTYLAGQALLIGPLAWGLGVWASWKGLVRRDPGTLLLIATSLPVIAIFGVTSYRALAGPNWPAFAYFSFSLLVAGWCLGPPSRLRRALWAAAFATSLALSLAVSLHARFRLIPPEWLSREAIEADATNWFHGWRELGEALQDYRGPAYVLAPSHQLAAEIIYYTQGRLPVQTDPDARPSQFDLWPQYVEFQGRNGLYVWTEGGAIGLYENYFVSATGEQRLNVYRNDSYLRSYRIVAGSQGLLSAAAPALSARPLIRLQD